MKKRVEVTSVGLAHARPITHYQISVYRISSIKRLPRINAGPELTPGVRTIKCKRRVSIKRRVKRKGVAMSTWCDSCSIASALPPTRLACA